MVLCPACWDTVSKFTASPQVRVPCLTWTRDPQITAGVGGEWWKQTFAVNEAESSCLTCRIIWATLKAPFECYFSVNLSDGTAYPAKWRNKSRAKSSWSPLWLSSSADLVSGETPLVLPIEGLQPLNASDHAIRLLTPAERQTAVSLKPVECFLLWVLF